MRKTFHLPLLAALPAVLAACGDNPDLDRYQRVKYNSYSQCERENRIYVQQGLSTPCQKTSGGYYGPYMYFGSGRTRYVGYTSSGGVSPSGLEYDAKRGTYGSFKAPGVSRGGFTSTGRAGSFGG